jgi:acetyl esterase/lipase
MKGDGMRPPLAAAAAALVAACLGVLALAQQPASLDARLDRLEAEVEAAEDLAAIKRLQRAYGYYLDKGMWADLAELFTHDAVANYPAGVYVGKESITRHLYMNVGGGAMGQVGLADGRLYNHMNIQPIVHLDPGRETAKGRWRAFAMFGNFGGGATWAEGIYNFTYAREDGAWKIRTLDYHSGFGAGYDTGWVAPEQPRAAAGRRNLPHPADRPRDEECAGFPDACIAPFHYDNPGSASGSAAWAPGGEPRSPARTERTAQRRAAELAARASRLADEQAIENLIKIYGYYVDRRMWDDVADLFADDGTIEMGLSGVYVGKPRIRAFLEELGPAGLTEGELNDHVQLQPIVTVSAAGRTAKARSRALGMTGVYEQQGEWSEGIYENTFVNEDGVWKFKSLRYYPTFITDYDAGWARDAKPAPAASEALPPDRPPTDVYEIYPKAHIPPFHYRNPVTGLAPQYPADRGRPSPAALAAVLAPVQAGAPRESHDALEARGVDALLTEAERIVARVKDYHELENLENAYGYYLDKNLWNDLANLFAEGGSMELAQRGFYRGRERVRGFLFEVFGPEGPQQGRLGNHVQMQHVIHVAPDGESARIRARMMQQLSFGGRPSMGAAVYENEAVKEDGVWKFSKVHAFNTWTAGYDGGWVRSPGRRVPGPSESYPPDGPPTFEFEMFPAVYEMPFHYANPVSGRPTLAPPSLPRAAAADDPGSVHVSGADVQPHPPGMPEAVASALREIGARIAGPETAALYEPLHRTEPYDGIAVTRDARYGTHERHVLDVFTTPDAGRGKPVVVFVHGGGFARGAKRAAGSPFYDNVMLWAAEQGLVGVNINYRLAPEHRWPSGIEDVTAVVEWIERNIEHYGGDPAKLFLWGHSAGAAHVGDYLAHGEPGKIAGAILTSGIYDLGQEVSIWEAYYGDDVSSYAERSSLRRLAVSDVPLLINDAELDPENFRSDTAALVEARRAAGKPMRYLRLPNHSHLSETYAVGTDDRSLSAPVLGFIREHAR